MPHTTLRAAWIGALIALVATLGVAASADAATIYACQKKKGGTIRIVSKKTKCKKTEKKFSFNTQGPTGTNGANGANGANGTNGKDGTNGTNGAAGEPRTAVKFAVTQPNDGTSAALFSAGGVDYTFKCNFVLVLNIGSLQATAASGNSYATGTIRRPTGVTALANDETRDVNVTTLGGGAKTIAALSTGANSGGSVEQLGVWSIAVESPGFVTFITATLDSASSCSVRGSAITVPAAT